MVGFDDTIVVGVSTGTDFERGGALVDDDLKSFMGEAGEDVLHGPEKVASVRGITKVDIQVVTLDSAIGLARSKTRIIRKKDVVKTPGGVNELGEGVCESAGGRGLAKFNSSAVDEDWVFKTSVFNEFAKVKPDKRGRGVQIDNGARVLVMLVDLVGLELPPCLSVDEPGMTIRVKKTGLTNVEEGLHTEGAFGMWCVV